MNWFKLFQSRKDPESLLSADQRVLAVQFVASVREWALLRSIQLVMIREPHRKLADMISSHGGSCNHVLDQVELYPLDVQSAWHKRVATHYLSSVTALEGGVVWRTRVNEAARAFAGRIPRDGPGHEEDTYAGLDFRGTEWEAIGYSYCRLIPNALDMVADDFRWPRIRVGD